MPSSGQILAQQFDKLFEVRLARTPAQRQDVHRIRGDVYCKEFRYEPEEKCLDGLEQDDYDDQSVHCVITHRQRRSAAGCIRLILAPAYDPVSRLPFEQFCDSANGKNITDRNRLRVAEVSRLAVRSEFRKPGQNSSESERQIFPLVTIALFMAGTALSELTGRTDNYAMMEPRLARLLKCSSGLNFKQVGPLVDYHGLRAAFRISTETAIATMHPRLQPLYYAIHDSLEADYSNVPLSFMPGFLAPRHDHPRPLAQPGLPFDRDVVYTPA